MYSVLVVIGMVLCRCGVLWCDLDLMFDLTVLTVILIYYFYCIKYPYLILTNAVCWREETSMTNPNISNKIFLFLFFLLYKSLIYYIGYISESVRCRKLILSMNVGWVVYVCNVVVLP